MKLLLCLLILPLAGCTFGLTYTTPEGASVGTTFQADGKQVLRALRNR